MVVIMVTAFTLAWFPYAVFAMYNTFNPDNQVRFSFIVNKKYVS